MIIMVECNDIKCPVHGSISTRGFRVVGNVVSARGKRTAVIEREAVRRIKKYARYARGKSRIMAHNPDCMNAQIGDVVQIEECRKISKTKAWVVSKILHKGAGYLEEGQAKARDEKQVHRKEELRVKGEKKEAKGVVA